MLAALRIVVDVARYRLRRLEMANVAGALAIGLALGVEHGELAVRMGFALVLNLLVYLNNDFHDLEDDLQSASKHSDKTRFLSEHRLEALFAQGALAIALTVFAAWWDRGLLAPLLVGGGVCWLYSAWLKRRAGFDVLAMVVWGAAMPLVGMPLTEAHGWLLVGQLALFSGCFESIQVLRDREEDLEHGIRTTAVALGSDRTKRLIRAMLVASAVYAALVFHPLLGIVPAAALAFPIAEGGIRRYWNRVRFVLGATFVIECLVVSGW